MPPEVWAVGTLVAAVLFLAVLPASRRDPAPVGGKPAAIEVRPLPLVGTPSPVEAAETPAPASQGAKPSRKAIQVQGTADPEAITDDAIAPTPPPSEPPARVLDSYDGRQRFVARLTDASMKRTVLAYVARWGGATDASGGAIESASMFTSQEDLLVTIAQDDFEEFTSGLDALRRQGIAVEWVPKQDLVGADTVRIVLSLELVEDPSAP